MLSRVLLAGDVALLPYADGASPRRGSLLACAAHGLPIVSTQPASRAVADAVHAVAPDAATLAAAVLEVADASPLAARLRAAARALTRPHRLARHRRAPTSRSIDTLRAP